MRFRGLIFAIVLLCLQTPAANGNEGSKRTQIGYIRTQSLFGAKESKPLPDAYVTFDNEQLARSKSDGLFEFDMQDYDDEATFQIKSVTHKRYTLLTNEYLETRYKYTPSPLLIIMKDEKELDRYVENILAQNTKENEKRYNAEIDKIKKNASLTEKEKDRQINKLTNELFLLKNEIQKSTRSFLSNADYATSDSLKKAIWKAIFEGDFNKVDSLNSCRIDRKSLEDSIAITDERIKYLTESLEGHLRAQSYYIDALIDRTRVDLLVAAETMKLDSMLFYYNTLIKYEPSNIQNYIDAGEFAENILCDIAGAIQYYELANKKAEEYDADVENRADAYLHLAKLSMLEGYYNKALSYLNKADELCGGNEKIEHTHRTYLLLGELETIYGNHKKALEYFNKVASDHVRKHFPKRYIEANINIATIKQIFGQIKEARAILEEVNFDNLERYSFEDFDLTHSFRMAYYEYLLACNEYQKAFDYIEESETLLKSYHTGENHFSANILLEKSLALFQLGKVRESLNCIDRAMRIIQDIFGDTHPSYIAAMVVGSSYLSDIGEFRLAEEMAINALNILADKFGAYAYNTLRIRNVLISMYKNLQETEMALEQIRICKEIISQSELPDNQTILDLEYQELLLSEGNGNHEKILKTAQEYAQCIEKEIGENSSFMLNAYNRLGDSYLYSGDNKKAEYYFKKALALSESINGKNSVFTKFQEMRTLVLLPSEGKENIDNALKSCSKVETSLTKILGKDNFLLCQVYQPLSSYYTNIGNAPLGKEYAKKYYDIISRTFNDDHRLTVDPLLNLFSAYMLAGDMRLAEETILRAIDITLREYGEDSGYMLTCSGAYIRLLINQGKLKDARREIDRHIANIESSIGYENPTMASALMLSSQLETSPKAIREIYDNVGEIYSKFLDKNNYSFASLYLAIAQLEAAEANVNTAMEYYEKAIDIIRHNFGENSIREAYALAALFEIHCVNADVKSLKSVLERIKQLERIHGGIPDAETHILEATIYNIMGENEKVAETINSYLATMREKYGDGCIWECQCLNFLGKAFLGLYEIETAKSYFEQSLEISKRHLDNDKVFNTAAYEGLANVYLNLATPENCMKANNIYKSLKAQYIKQYDSKHPKAVDLDASIGETYLRMCQISGNTHDYKEACKYLKQNLDATIGIYGNQANLRVASSQFAMAECYIFGGEVEKALTHYLEALSSLEEIYGETHYATVNTLANIGLAYGLIHDLDNAQGYFHRALEAIEANGDFTSKQLYEIYSRIASGFSMNERYMESMDLLAMCLKMADAKEIDITDENKAALILNLGRDYLALGNKEVGLALLKRALNSVEKNREINSYQKYSVAFTGVQILFNFSRDIELMDKYLTFAEEQIPEVEHMSNSTEYFIYMCRSALCKGVSDRDGYISNLHKAFSLAKKCKIAPQQHLADIKAELELLHD